MESELFKMAVTQGIWCALFLFMLLYVLRENAKREGKYQDIISALTEKFETIEKGICDIKDEIRDKFKGR